MSAASVVASVADRLDTPMVIVTARDGARRAGCLVGFATQCSIDPARWLVCISEKNATFAVAMAAEALAIHFLGDDDRGHRAAELFGEQTDDEIDKFSLWPWRDGSGGVVLLDGLPAWVAGPVVSRHRAGDHTAMVVNVTDGEIDDAWQTPLGYLSVRDLHPGHEA
jgi:flavin reductase (DIM6/NTAB) family NADH-FMN oxidoreductase RutF